MRSGGIVRRAGTTASGVLASAAPCVKPRVSVVAATGRSSGPAAGSLRDNGSGTGGGSSGWDLLQLLSVGFGILGGGAGLVGLGYALNEHKNVSDTFKDEREKLAAEQKALVAEREAVKTTMGALVSERQAFQSSSEAQRDSIKSERDLSRIFMGLGASGYIVAAVGGIAYGTVKLAKEWQRS